MRLVIFLLSLLLPSVLVAQNRAYIHNQNLADPSFDTFKLQLAAAVEKRDINLLSPLLGDSILESRNGLCKYCSKAKFISISCKEDSSKVYSNDFWQQAEFHLKLGFARPTERNPDDYATLVQTGEHYISPPYNYHNNNDTILVFDTGVIAYSEPFITSKPVGKVNISAFATVNTHLADDYDFFIYNQDEDIAYIRIQLSNGKTGYVKQKHTSQAIYKQMTVAKINGKWKIVSFYHPPGC